MPNAAYCHLHLHTEFSMLDGLGSVNDYVARAVLLGHPAMAITDHGNMCGHPSFYKACRKAGIEPVLGQEFYVVQDASWRPAKGEKQPERFHLTVLAKGHKGHRVLSELSTAGHANYYYKPVIDVSTMEALGKDAKHLVVLSGCAGSLISRSLTEGQDDVAEHWLMWFRETFPHFYIELMHHGTDFDKDLNADLINLGRKYDVPWTITNDPHYVDKEDHGHHDTLLAIQTAADIDAPDRFRFDGTGYHLRSRQELRRLFRKHYGDDIWKPGARETLNIAKACKVRIPAWESSTWQIPKFPDVDDSFRELKRLAKQGLRDRGLHRDRAYVERMQLELDAFGELEFTTDGGQTTTIADFLLITRDALMAAKAQGIRVGPGRGSVCGSLVAWLVGIHKIDPIRYDLLFERFFNPARPRQPDIDSDFAQSGRSWMFTYTIDKYGEDNVVAVCAYAHMKVKRCFQSLARAHGIPWAKALEISKELQDDDDHNYDLPKAITEGYPDLAAQLKRLAGLKASISAHPAGVVIADPSIAIAKQVPQMWIPSSKRWVGQYDLKAVEGMGLMKQDYLGLRTLDTIDQCLQNIKTRTGEDIDPDEWLPDAEEHDKRVWKMLARGETAGVFQMEGPTNQRGIRAIKPRCFEDVVSCTSLYRTGAIAAGFPKVFLHNRKRGAIDYVHPSLEPILGTTGGVVLYQEQVMEMGRTLAGFDMVQVDDIKEAIKHKESALMQSMREPFIEGCMRVQGMTRKQATECWRYIEGYSGYGYNRSHAVAYTFTTYQTARLKCLYPVDFYAALIATVDTAAEGGWEKRDAYLREAYGKGFKILPPDINESDLAARPTAAGDAIRLGLTDYAGIGDKTALRLLEARSGLPGGRFTRKKQVFEACNNTRAYAVLRDGGALAPLKEKGDPEKMEELLKWQFSDRMAGWRKKYKSKVKLPTDETAHNEHVTLVGEIYKVTRATTKGNKPYVTWKIRWSITDSFDIRLWSETKKFWNLKEGDIVQVRGRWEPKWLNISCGNPSDIKVVHRVN